MDDFGEDRVDPERVDELLESVAHINASPGSIERTCAMCPAKILISVEEALDRPEPSNWDLCRDCLETVFVIGTDQQIELLMNSK